MSAALLLGKSYVDNVMPQLAQQLADAKVGKLCTIGFDEDCWNQYSSSLGKSAAKYGVEWQNIVADANMDVQSFCQLVADTCARSDVSGVLLQQPLPMQYACAVEYVSPNKDVDCLNPLSVAKLYAGIDGFRPATPLAVLRLLNFYNVDLKGKNVVIVGRGNAVGKPLALMALKQDATVTVCHTKTKNLSAVCRNADVVVSACGVAGLITANHIKEGAIVVDVGLSFVDGKTCGDVSLEVQNVAEAVSPVPGGVGPVTRTCIFENLLFAAQLQNQ